MEKFKRIIFKSPILSLAGLCFVIALFVFVFAPETTTAGKVLAKKFVPSATNTPSPTKAEQITDSVSGQTVIASTTPTQSNAGQTSTDNKQQSTPTAAPTAVPTNVPSVQTYQVTLAINGSSVGSVTVEAGANQCDVLTKAKDQGKISSLLMKYDNSLGTNGVYQINGIGKENSIWWVYKVNGQSPNQGCSYIKANSGDSIEWEYKG